MLAIKSNIMAVNAARHLGDSYGSLASSVERLSSGLRINSAKDDAAGMAVRELMRADIATLEQGNRNAQDGISMLQTMEGAMAVVDDNLTRMKELSEQAATGSYSDAQRTIMNSEFGQMAAEIDRIVGDTKFNGIAMLDNTNTVSIHVGSSTTIDVTGSDLKTATLGVDTGTLDISTAAGAATALTALTTAITTKDTARAKFGYSMNRLESTTSILGIQIENLQASESRISDVDVATEMANMTKNQVLTQAGVSMLSQANGMPQMALSLLR